MKHFTLLSLLLLSACAPAPETGSGFDAAAELKNDSVEGYARALKPRKFDFPRDHGAHPKYRNEWWYITGNLDGQNGRRFGFQITFFRIALTPLPEPRNSNWATNQAWMAHAAITDVKEKRHLARERFARGAAELAGARLDPFRVWLEDWELSGTDNKFPWYLAIDTREFSLALELLPLKDPVPQGDQGLSRKSGEPGNASYYYSVTRIQAEGTLRIGDSLHPVTGLAWLDREWSTSALAENQSGWDWFSLQLNDGTDLMYYRLRDKENNTDPYSCGTLVDAQKRIIMLGPDNVSLEPVKWWTGRGGKRYPVVWNMRVKPLSRRFRIQAVLANQEMDLRVRYWEGAVDVIDLVSGESLGRGYMEMTGY